MAYTLEQFVADLDRITRAESDATVITERVAPLLAELVKHPESIPAEYRRSPDGQRGRYMLHRAPLFNISSVVWGPGDNAKAHNHDTWGLVGVHENELQETRFVRLDDGSKEGHAELEVKGVNRNQSGMVSTLLAPENDIHEMLNVTKKNTVEVHVYGKELVNMQRLQFDVATRSVKFFASAKYDNC